MLLGEAMRYFEQKLNAVISIEPVAPELFSAPEFRIAPDQQLHHGCRCRDIKLSDKFTACVKNKSRSMFVAARGRDFSGFCPQGIWDMAHPVIMPGNGNLAAILYIGRRDGVRPELREKEQLRHALHFIGEFLLVELMRNPHHDGNAKKRSPKFYVDYCMNIIDCKYREMPSLSDLASLLRVNANYLGALLKKETGQTFRELLNKRRISEASLLLRLHHTLSITEISRRCGFSDSNYFCVVFHQAVGMAPSAYRRKFAAVAVKEL